MGELLRRYWHPVATSKELETERVLAVKILGENLALYKTDEGKLGLVSQRCPHRGASLAYGIPEEEGLRCPYHGWRFDQAGQCNDMPAEPEDSTFKHRIKVPAYPVEEMGGLVWAYMGPEPAPFLRRFDLYVREDIHREIGVTKLPCNWVQVMENSLDPHHLEWLHGYYMRYVLERRGMQMPSPVRHHAKVGYDVFEWGIIKRRVWEGQTEDTSEWQIGHPILFPNTLAVGSEGLPQFQIRVPMDDENTLHFWYECKPLQPGEAPQRIEDIEVLEYPYMVDGGRLVVETVSGQDMMAWVTQGALSPRETERLGTSDKGVILYRNLLLEMAEKVQRGEDPMATVRDPEKGLEMIPIRRENPLFRASGANRELFAVRKELNAKA
jgi:5,5'-dehydrodivanillate O-demethylase